MKCTNIQYSLIISIIIIMYYLFIDKNNSNNDSLIDNVLDKINDTNNSDNNNYNYSDSYTITMNDNNNKDNVNVTTNSSTFKNNNLDTIRINENNVYVDVKFILHNDSFKNVYTKGTIPENLNNVLTYYLKNILSVLININTFNIRDIERVYEEIDTHNNRRYVIIFFVYNLNFFNSNKLVIDFVVNFNTNFVYLNNVREFYNAYPNLINKYDFQIGNRGYLADNTIEEDLNEILKNDYLKHSNYAYLSDSSLDFTNIYLSNSRKCLQNLSKIYLPNTQSNLIEKNICDKNINGTWDKYGNLKKGNENCILHNSSSTKNIHLPTKYPNFADTRNSNYDWLIDVSRNNIIRQHGYTI